jgi:hypothetical protein
VRIFSNFFVNFVSSCAQDMFPGPDDGLVIRSGEQVERSDWQILLY